MKPPYHYQISEINSRVEGLVIRELLTPEFLADQLAGTEADAAQGEIYIELTLSKDIDRQIVLRGKITGTLALACQRCLEYSFVPLDIPLHVRFFLEGHKVQETEEFDLDAADYAFYNKSGIDLAPIVRENLLLEFPATILCKENCLGLCPSCGINLNQEVCSCET